MSDLFGLGDPKRAPVPPTVSAEFARANTARLSLRYVWDPALPVAAFLMNNPSVAGGEKDFDPTARRTIHFAKVLGAGGASLFNWCPLVATDPADLWRMLQARRFDDHLQRTNLETIAAGAAAADWHIVACGPEGFRRYPDMVQRALHAFIGKGANVPWTSRPIAREARCLGVTPEGAPLHPLARGKFAIPNGTYPGVWMPGLYPYRSKGSDPIVYGRM